MPDRSGRGTSPCGAWWNDPNADDMGYLCEREQGHDGSHRQVVSWPADEGRVRPVDLGAAPAHRPRRPGTENGHAAAAARDLGATPGPDRALMAPSRVRHTSATSVALPEIAPARTTSSTEPADPLHSPRQDGPECNTGNG